MYLRQKLLLPEDKINVSVDGIRYTLENDKLIVIDILDVDDSGIIKFDGVFSSIRIRKVINKKVRDKIRVLDLSNISSIQSNCTFSGCVNLLSVKGNKIKRLPKGTFYGCLALEEVQFSNLRIIEEDAFYNCISLKTLNVKRVSEIHDRAFGGSGIVELTIGNLKGVDGGFCDMHNLRRLCMSSIDCLFYNFMTLHLEYLDLGSFYDNAIYYDIFSNAFYSSYLNSYKVSHYEWPELLKEDTKYGSRYFPNRLLNTLTNDFLDYLPFRHLKEIHYKLDHLSVDLQNYYDKRFHWLENLGIKVVRDA